MEINLVQQDFKKIIYEDRSRTFYTGKYIHICIYFCLDAFLHLLLTQKSVAISRSSANHSCSKNIFSLASSFAVI